MAKRRKRMRNSDDYMNTAFILGSVLEIERFFRYAKYVQHDNRGRMKPQHFEAFSFLTANERFCYGLFVVKAVHGARKQRSDERIHSHEARKQYKICT